MASSGAVSQSSGPKKARIEIIPLIDVVFFLLATFVLFTLSLNKIQSVPINLPKASDQKSDSAEPVIIQVSDAGSVYWNRDPISMSEVTPRLLQYSQSDPANAKVLVSGDDRAKFGAMVEVLDRVREAGIAQVSIETAYRASGR
jgi:biopolymer transport protein ExbD